MNNRPNLGLLGNPYTGFETASHQRLKRLWGALVTLEGAGEVVEDKAMLFRAAAAKRDDTGPTGSRRAWHDAVFKRA
jgi:hypothetical protein